MKALILEEYEKLVYQDVPDPVAKPDEVLVRVKACGICGSDVHGLDGSTGRRIPPLIMGHEASGVIEKIGDEVGGWEPGDRVTFDSTIYPLDDWFTLRGSYNLSENRRVLGVSQGEYNQPGAFAELVAVPQHILYRIPDAVSFEEAAMVEPVAVAAHAVNLTDLALQDTALVVGVGMIGLFVVQLLANSNAGTIIAVDVDDSRLEMARSFGADLALHAEDQELREKIRESTERRGADVAFEVVGISDTLFLCLENVRKGGNVTLVGNLAPKVDLPLQSVVTREIKLQGSCAIAGEYPTVLGLLERGTVQVQSLISAVAPLTQGPEWFERLHQKEPGLFKVLLVP